MIPYLLLLSTIAAADNVDFSKSDGIVISLMSSKKVVSEFDLTTEQQKRLAEIKRNAGPRISAFIRQVGPPADEAGRQIRSDLLRQQKTEIDSEVVAILSATQAKRLHQLIVQYRARQERFSFGLLNHEIAKHLQLTDNQRQRLEAEAKEFEDEFQIHLSKLREKIATMEGDCLEDLLTKLSPAQRFEYDDLFGKPFYLPSEDRGFAQLQLLLRNMRQKDVKKETE